MGTRSTIKFYSEFDQEKVLVSIYQQCDGYIGGVGYELAHFLSKKKVINGISDQTLAGGYANGMGCLAAQFIKDYKVKIGGLYVAHPDDGKQDYNYEVRLIDNQLIITVNDIFKGTSQELLELIEDSE